MSQSNRRSSFGTDENSSLFEATVQSVEKVSPTIKKFELLIEDPKECFSFQSGMFLDFYLSPSITTIITGFSICNTIEDYHRTKKIELAIRRSEYPPTMYMFDQCQENEKISVRPGGKFFYDSKLNENDSVLLLCAGIGANPIVSMLRHISDLHRAEMYSSMPYRTAFFYTAAHAEDLVFRQDIDRSCQKMIEDNLLRTHYFTTRQINDQPQTNNRRINNDDLLGAIRWLEKPVTAYICGPRSFIDWIEKTLTDLHVEKIFYEKWW